MMPVIEGLAYLAVAWLLVAAILAALRKGGGRK